MTVSDPLCVKTGITYLPAIITTKLMKFTALYTASMKVGDQLLRRNMGHSFM